MNLAMAPDGRTGRQEEGTDSNSRNRKAKHMGNRTRRMGIGVFFQRANPLEWALTQELRAGPYLSSFPTDYLLKVKEVRLCC